MIDFQSILNIINPKPIIIFKSIDILFSSRKTKILDGQINSFLSYLELKKNNS